MVDSSQRGVKSENRLPSAPGSGRGQGDSGKGSGVLSTCFISHTSSFSSDLFSYLVDGKLISTWASCHATDAEFVPDFNGLQNGATRSRA